MPIRIEVRDPVTGATVAPEDFLKEDWTRDLCAADVTGFALDEEGALHILDDTGTYVTVPEELDLEVNIIDDD